MGAEPAGGGRPKRFFSRSRRGGDAGPPRRAGPGQGPSPARLVLPFLPPHVPLSPRLIPREAMHFAASPPPSPAAASPGGTRRGRRSCGAAVGAGGPGGGGRGEGSGSPSPPGAGVPVPRGRSSGWVLVPRALPGLEQWVSVPVGGSDGCRFPEP